MKTTIGKTLQLFFCNMDIFILQVVLQKCKVKSLLHSPGDYILLSADKYEIKVRFPLYPSA